jgi:sugar phosphate isomerase/epimerase
MGHILPSSWKCIDEGRSLIDIAAGFGAPFVRVFPFRVPKGPLETRHATVRRIAGRVARLADSCRHLGVVMLMENGGDFASADDLAEIVDRASHPGVRGCYDIAAGVSAGDDPTAAIDHLGERLAVVRLRDRRGDHPVELGTGDLPNAQVVSALGRSGFTGWITYEWERAWIDGLASPELALPRAVQAISSWLGATPLGAHSAA